MFDIIKISLIAYMFVFLGEPDSIFSCYQRLIDKIPWDWLYKPLGGCSKCFTGQVMFWYYLIFKFKEYNFFDHLFFVSAGIVCAMIYDKLIDYLNGTQKN